MKPRRARSIFQYVLGFLVFLGAWWGGSYLAGSQILPPPGEVVRYIFGPGMIRSFLAQVSLTAGRGILGFSVAWIVALPLGFLMGRHRAGERIGFFPLFLLQSAPPLFWVTPLVLWLGTRGQVAPAVAFLVSLPLLSVHTMMAIKHIPDYEFNVFRVYAPRARVIARELYIPGLIPSLKSNIHLGILVAIKAAMLAEWFAAQDGFGQTIRIHYQFFAMTEFMGWALLFLLLVGGLSLALRATLSHFLPQYRATPVPGGPSAAPPAVAPTVSTFHDARDNPPRAAGLKLNATDLSFSYGRTPVFSGLGLELTPGPPLVLHGESGCGKTTLLKTLCGLLPPTSGSVTASGRVGLVFQQDALLSHRDALGNVLLPSMPRFTTADIDHAMHCLELWGLEDARSKFPHELSGGMQKRLAMARAWFLRTPILLLDEPFVNLDREARVALWELLFRRISEREMALLIVTHYPEELERFDTRMKSWTELTRAADRIPD